ncbi:toxin-antitoxin system YwqK family antitoxin [Polaribacter sp.]|nr:toxin-antitoxin system YwqK family antitoxin [Polaribacter sp.]
MKILKRSITVLFCLILFTSCTKSIDRKKEKSYIEERKGIIYYKDEPFTGEMFENYKNGQLQLKENYKDGVRNGVFESYYENGQLAEKENYKFGDRDGSYEGYFESGQLKSKENYKDGVRNGEFESYYENGQLNGKLSEGEYKSYYENGQLKENYKYGNSDGLYEGYYENGQLAEKGSYKPVEITSELVEQINQAKLVWGLEELAPLASGVILLRNGVFISNHNNGQLFLKTNYKDGKRNGLYESYYENGQLAEKYNYKDGNSDGLFESYYENGQLKSKEYYRDGLNITFSYKSRNINVSEIKTECKYVDAASVLLSEMVVLAEVYSKSGKTTNNFGKQASDRNFLDKLGTKIGTQVRGLREFDFEKMKSCPKYKTYLDLLNKYKNLPQIFT